MTRAVTEKTQVSSLALDKGAVRLSIIDIPDRPGTAAAVLSRLAAAGVPLDMILQSPPGGSGTNSLSFMTDRSHAGLAGQALREAARRLRAPSGRPHRTARVEEDEAVAKVSVIGTGFRRSPGVASLMFQTLAKSRINIHMIEASDLRVSAVIEARQGERGLRALHKAFRLGKRR